MYAGTKLHNTGGLVATGGVGRHNSLLRVGATHSHRIWSNPALAHRPNLVVSQPGVKNYQLTQNLFQDSLPKYMYYNLAADQDLKPNPQEHVDPDLLHPLMQIQDEPTLTAQAQGLTMDPSILGPSLLFGIPQIRRFFTEYPLVLASALISLGCFSLAEAHFNISQNILAAGETVYKFVPVLLISLVTLALGRVTYDASKWFGAKLADRMDKKNPDKTHSPFLYSLPFQALGYSMLGLFSTAAIDSFELVPKSVFLGALGVAAVSLHTIFKDNVSGVVNNLLLSRLDKNLSRLKEGDELMLGIGRATVTEVDQGRGLHLKIETEEGVVAERFASFKELADEQPSMIVKSPVVEEMAPDKTHDVVSHFLDEVQSGRVTEGQRIIFYKLTEDDRHVAFMQGNFARIQGDTIVLISNDDSVIHYPLSEISRVAVYWKRKTDSRTDDRLDTTPSGLVDRLMARADIGK